MDNIFSAVFVGIVVDRHQTDTKSSLTSTSDTACDGLCISVHWLTDEGMDVKIN